MKCRALSELLTSLLLADFKLKWSAAYELSLTSSCIGSASSGKCLDPVRALGFLGVAERTAVRMVCLGDRTDLTRCGRPGRSSVRVLDNRFRYGFPRVKSLWILGFKTSVQREISTRCRTGVACSQCRAIGRGPPCGRGEIGSSTTFRELRVQVRVQVAIDRLRYLHSSLERLSRSSASWRSDP